MSDFMGWLILKKQTVFNFRHEKYVEQTNNQPVIKNSNNKKNIKYSFLIIWKLICLKKHYIYTVL